MSAKADQIEKLDPAWAKARAALLASPMDEPEEVGKRLKLSPTALQGMIEDNGGKRAIWSERDLKIAETLAKIAKDNPDATSYRELARVAQDALPGLSDFNIKQLKKRHPEVLEHIEARGLSAPLPPVVRERIKELALAHPTLDYGQLATMFAKDATLKGVLPWTEAEVSRLREPSRIVPSERKREKALIQLATAHLTKSKGDLGDALVALAKLHPGVTREQLVSLGAHDPLLAKQLRRLTKDAPTVAPVALDLDTAKKLDLGAPILTRSLAASVGGLVSELSAAIAKIESTAGDNDGTLAPRDLGGAEPIVAKVMGAVYEALGKKSHPLTAIDDALPAAIARVANQGRLFNPLDVYRRATEDALRALAAAYKKEVLDDAGTLGEFLGSRKIVSKTWLRIKATLPASFPDASAPTGERLEAVSALYAKLLEGELTTTGFYSRAKIGVDELRLIQASEPKLFPKPAGTPSWRSVAGRREVKALDVDLLAKRFRAEVISGDKSLGEFLRDEGVSTHRFADIRAEHPKKFDPIPGKKTTDDVLAKAIGAKARAEFARDVLTDVPEVLAALNLDPALTELVGGPILRSRYDGLRGKYPKYFPKFKDPSLILPVLAKEVRALLKKQPDLTPLTLTAEMKKLHPGFKMSRVYQLREAYPDLVPGKGPKPEVDRKADAELLAARMKADPNRTLQQYADDMAPLGERFSAPYLSRLRKTFQASVFDDAAIAYKARPIARESHTAGALLVMAVRLAPPGSTEAQLVRAYDALLEARQIPPFGTDTLTAGMRKALDARHGGLEKYNSGVVREIADEYARAAEKGATEKEIFSAILADYPSLDVQKLSTYRNLWALKKPLVGKGEDVQDPRYLGGWDIERALLAPARSDPPLAKGLAELSAHARVPLTLPLLDKVIDDLDGKKPLAHKNLLWVTHVLASTYPLSIALRQAGLAASKSIVVGTPYGTNDAVKSTLVADGFDVRRPKLEPTAYRAEVEKAVDAIVALHKKNHEPVVVMDDGGLVAEILRSNPKYKDVIGAFKIVEQTTRGITAAEQDTVTMPVINVARSKSKLAEAPLIGRAVAAKVIQGLTRLGKDLQGKEVTVVGYGTIGAKIAAELRKAGALVTIVESSDERTKKAKRAGFTVSTKEKAFPKSSVVIGATGTTSIQLEDLKRLPSGAVFASASSKRLEIDMGALEKASSKRTEIAADSPLVTLPTCAYRLGGKELTALGDGWPINFDGDVEDIPAEEIQLTRAVMLAGAIQAASVKPHQTANKGVIALDEALDQSVLEGFRALMKARKGQQAIGDPSQWMEALREAGAMVQGAID